MTIWSTNLPGRCVSTPTSAKLSQVFPLQSSPSFRYPRYAVQSWRGFLEEYQRSWIPWRPSNRQARIPTRDETISNRSMNAIKFTPINRCSNYWATSQIINSAERTLSMVWFGRAMVAHNWEQAPSIVWIAVHNSLSSAITVSRGWASRSSSEGT